jgi:two-component system nitrate/nitrite response regulator NarL
LLRRVIDIFVIAAVRLYREGLADALQRDGRVGIAGTAASWPDGLTQIAALPQPPDVLLADPGAPAAATGFRALRQQHPSVRVVALAVREVDEDVVAWAEAGVAGVVTRDASLDQLLTTVEEIARGENTVTAALLRRVAVLAAERRHAAPRVSVLTSREREIVDLLDRGLSNKEIAARLRIEMPTVKNHVHHILEKLQVQRRAEVAAAARALEQRI